MAGRTSAVPEERVAAPGEALDHVVCCRDGDRSFCGIDVSSVPFTTFSRPSCVVCDDIDRSIPEGCCPWGGMCPEPD